MRSEESYCYDFTEFLFPSGAGLQSQLNVAFFGESPA